MKDILTSAEIDKESQRYAEVTEYRVIVTQRLKEARECKAILKLYSENEDLQSYTDSREIIRQLTSYTKMKLASAQEYEEYMTEAKEYE